MHVETQGQMDREERVFFGELCIRKTFLGYKFPLPSFEISAN